ncbi:MAG: hypothetical protein GX126_04885 [Bacteroidales bacterium]|nr:hypothetical protein [Bacteroidales bacterium]
MKTKPYFSSYIIAIITILGIMSCKSDDGITLTQIKTFISSGDNDGYIENLSSPVVHNYFSGSQGKSLCVGWNSNGYCMRSFLNFDISTIMPSSDKELIIDEALLQVFEANTNMHPFDGAGVRVVNCYLLNYGTLDKSDYGLAPFADCGAISTWGYNVLKEYPLNVTAATNDFLVTNPTENKLQFRLQFLPDGNVQKSSPIVSSMWNIFSGEETQKSDYRPKLTISYHYNDKQQ